MEKTAAADGAATTKPQSKQNTGGPIRLSSVQGYETRTNDIIYCPPLERVYIRDGKDLQNHAIVYFGGDIQDFPENMQVHHDSKAYIKYNLENTALMLRNNFPTSHIVVIKAVRMEFKTFSCYDNFVRGCNAGIPDHTPMNYALQHLEKLLQNVGPRIKAIPENELVVAMTRATPRIGAEEGTDSGATTGKGNNNNNGTSHDANQDVDIDVLDNNEGASTSSSSSSSSSNHVSAEVTGDGEAESPPIDAKELLWWRDTVNMDKAELTLIAFSKGSVVLNQLIYEFHYIKTLTPDDCSMMRLVSRIRAMYWLDGGHSAPKNTWITSRSLLETLERLNVSIHVHVTPYQVLDDRRPWIRRDEKAFTDLLKRLGANLTRVLHFDSGTTNLFTHFEVLEVFRQYELQAVAAEQALEEAKAAAAAASALANAATGGAVVAGGEEEVASAERGGDSEASPVVASIAKTEEESNSKESAAAAKTATTTTTTVGEGAATEESGKEVETEMDTSSVLSDSEPMSDDCSN